MLIRLDANATIGLGHLGRCLALAKPLARLRVKPVFALSAASSQDAFARLRAQGQAVVEVPVTEPGCAEDVRLTLDLVQEQSDRLLLVDGYQFRGAPLRELRRTHGPLAYIDDVLEGEFDVDVFINPSLHGDVSKVVLPARSQALLGAPYSLVRESFRAAREIRSQRQPNTARARILVTLGGADPNGATLNVLRGLAQVTHQDIVASDVTVLMARSSKHFESAEALARTCSMNVVIREPVPDLADLLPEVDLAIISASTTLLEISAVGIAAITMATVDNQEPVAEAATRLGVASVVDGSSQAIATALAELATDAARRTDMVARQRQLVDGLGAERVAAVLSSYATQ